MSVLGHSSQDTKQENIYYEVAYMCICNSTVSRLLIASMRKETSTSKAELFLFDWAELCVYTGIRCCILSTFSYLA